MKQIAIYGAGGYGHEVACLIKKINQLSKIWNFIGYFDDEISKGSSTKYGNILGGLEELNKWKHELNVVIAIANPNVVKSIVLKIKNEKILFPNLIEPDTSFLDIESFNIGKGNIIGYGCRFSCDISIGDFNLFIAETSIGHNAKIGNFNVLFPEIRISGSVNIGNENVFGARSFVVQGITIGNNTRFAPGSFVLKKTKDNCLYTGNPAKKF